MPPRPALKSTWTTGLRILLAALTGLAGPAIFRGQAPGASRVTPNLPDGIDRPLRYRPDGTDFVIENGAEFFNRPLYGGNTAFRVDAGDRPEFSVYLPGRGGNLRLGVKTAAGTKWLQAAEGITARYRPGEMLYDIRDALLGPGATLHLEVLALAATEGLVLRTELHGPAPPVELLWAYGGASGQRGRRDGDIGTEAVPIGEYFQLQPEFCRGNTLELNAGAFTLRSKSATLTGLTSPGAELAIGDARAWASPGALLASGAQGATELPVLLGHAPLTAGEPRFILLQRVADGAPGAGELDTYREVTAERAGVDRAPVPVPLLPAYQAAELPRVFAEAEEHFARLRAQVRIGTPDPFLNAAAAALNVAADAVWDEPQGVVMHGAIAWRAKLLGWRGPYAPDALGWHDRARRHFTYWAARQNTDAIPPALPPPDENANLARSEAALHSNGDLSNSHYDMNLVYIDALFRHLRWTGDLAFAREVWPVIERHLAWERRLFRREFGPEKLPLYEAYAAIWASDDLQYEGGGTAHASAYNYFHHREAARLARLLGHDAGPYEREAGLIARAMRELLWRPERGGFAEFKDWLGLQRVHPSAGLWTFYHILDSGLPTDREAGQMIRQVEQELPWLPVRGPGVPAGGPWRVPATTNWMPYAWSVNNVVMGEIMHAALGYWQAGQADDAFRLTKSALLASMFMGVCPGNVGSMNYLDVYRRESQRDFADGGGVMSRALIEGLFGVRPDLLAGELRFAPGFPEAWDHASLHHPDVTVDFTRAGPEEKFIVEPRFARPVTLRVQLPLRWSEIARVTLNGQPVAWQASAGTEDTPRIEFYAASAPRYEIVVTGRGKPVPVTAAEPAAPAAAPTARANHTDPAGPFDSVDLTPYFNDRVTQIFAHEYRSPRSPFVSLAIPRQGIGGWAGSINASAEIDDRGLRAAVRAGGGRLLLPNGVPLSTPGADAAPNVVFTSQWDNYPREITLPLAGRARHLWLLMAGSTNWMQSRIDNGEVVVTYTDGSTARLALENPTTWWPIEQDYFTDSYAFHREGPVPWRIALQTGRVYTPAAAGGIVPGGAATVLDLALDPGKELRSLAVRTLSNEVVVGLMALTVARP